MGIDIAVYAIFGQYVMDALLWFAIPVTILTWMRQGLYGR